MRFLVSATLVTCLIAGCNVPSEGPPVDTSPDLSADAAGGDSGGGDAAGPFGIGSTGPAFEGLIGVDDAHHSLADYADANAVVLVFTCNHCPVAVAYEQRLVDLHNEYAEQGVQLVAINVNNLEADKLPAMKERAASVGFEFPYLYDPTQQIARDYGATVTPQIFLLDNERKLAFVGPIDDEMDVEKVTQHYLRDAIDAVLAGEVPAVAQVDPFGCGIKYE